MIKLKQSLDALRLRRNSNQYATRVKAGRAQLVRVIFHANGKSTVYEESPWLAIPELVKFMDLLP